MSADVMPAGSTSIIMGLDFGCSFHDAPVTSAGFATTLQLGST